MTSRPTDILSLAHELKKRGDAFAVATVVRTVSLTAAKPGAKAIVDAEGQIIQGWIGGGCARHAVVKAARQAIADGQSRLVSIQPEELMAEESLTTDSTAKDESTPASTQTAPLHVQSRNLCPSKGSMDVFIEPMLANPELLIIGNSPVAQALAELGPLFDFDALLSDPSESTAELEEKHPHRYTIIATQGSGDLKALDAALKLDARHIGFVGSRRKIAHLKERMQEQGVAPELLARVHSPAGLDINAVTPQEIALSIVADLVQRRRA